MKVLSIESPQRLKNRTVKATITVSEDDYIPLIMLSDRAYKGDMIEIDIATKEDIQENTTLISLSLIIEAIKPVIQSQLNIVEKIGYQKAKEEIS